MAFSYKDFAPDGAEAIARWRACRNRSSALRRRLPQPKAALVVPELRATVGFHTGDVFPSRRTVQQADVSACGADVPWGVTVGLRVFVEVRLFTDGGPVGGVRRKDAQEAVAIDVQVGHE